MMITSLSKDNLYVRDNTTILQHTLSRNSASASKMQIEISKLK